MYPEVALSIAGDWREPSDGKYEPVLNPATGETVGRVPHASQSDLDDALTAAERAFREWRDVSAFERYKIMRKAAEILRTRTEDIAQIMTLEQGKPLAESRAETMAGADIIDWFAEEARRVYGRIIPPRASSVQQMVVREPVGPVAAFTPWNFPINQAVRKVSGAVANGCSVILKGPEETPGSCAELVRAFMDAGLPAGVVNLVFGVPARISEYLIAHPVIRKVTFTGSTAVGKQIAALAGQHMKRITMELGGHAPVVVFEDASFEDALSV
ncbi:MAG: aldehyde dehydrogenase family protein, partial [Proteobacteria bacterium]